MRRSNGNIFTNVVVALLVCSGIYGGLYSILLIWKKEDVKEIGDGFHTRTVHTADQIVQVVFVTREERLASAVTLINSIVKNTKNPVHFSIITDNQSVDHLWEWIENSDLRSISYQVTAVTSDWLSKNIDISKDEAKTLSYARLLFTKIFPSLKSRVIFLDDDLIVQGDISELFHTSIRPDKVGACSSDCDDISEKFQNQGNRYGNMIFVYKQPLRVLQLNSSACTFSLSVCVIDVQQWETYNISQNAIHWIQVNKKTKLYKGEGLLPALLIALDKKMSFLGADWRVQNIDQHLASSLNDERESNKAKVLHWNGARKPWTLEADKSVNPWNSYFVPDPTHKYSHSKDPIK